MGGLAGYPVGAAPVGTIPALATFVFSPSSSLSLLSPSIVQALGKNKHKNSLFSPEDQSTYAINSAKKTKKKTIVLEELTSKETKKRREKRKSKLTCRAKQCPQLNTTRSPSFTRCIHSNSCRGLACVTLVLLLQSGQNGGERDRGTSALLEVFVKVLQNIGPQRLFDIPSCTTPTCTKCLKIFGKSFAFEKERK